MCGIAGYSIAFGQPSISSLLPEIITKMSHRGPDDFGFFEDQVSGIALAHTRLSILDLSDAGHQPMISNDSNYVIAFNGEIYNFRELRHSLVSSGYVFRSESDTEVLLALYQDKGTDMLDCLNGIFVFAIWDRNNQTIFLARDGLGVKPLYYAALDDRFVFASELKALLPLLPENLQIDHIALEQYLTFVWSPGDKTPLCNVRKVLPGQAFIIRNGCIQNCWSWYQLPPYRPINFTFADESTLVDRTTDYLRNAVHRQLVSDVPVGAFLSGGLDSSAVVAFAKEKKSDIRCFTIDIRGNANDGFCPDLPYAKRVATHLNVPLEVVSVDSYSMASSLSKLIQSLDEPIADPASLNVLLICQLAREHGIKVLLSGAGGDDLFTGYRRHLAISTSNYISLLPLNVRILIQNLSSCLPSSYAFVRRLNKYLSAVHLDGDERVIHYFKWIDRSDLDVLYTPSFRHAVCTAQRDNPMTEFLAGLDSSIPSLERMLALEKRFFLPDHNLNYTDKMSMSVGVEVRVPFLDNQLVEFASRIPVHYKQRGREGKWILKKAMEPFLPHDVIYRPKTGFGAPVRRWLRFELRDWLRDILSPTRLHNRGLFDPQAVQRLIVANEEGKVDASYTLLSLACIELWCESFLVR